jgi:hypothetical protein
VARSHAANAIEAEARAAQRIQVKASLDFTPIAVAGRIVIPSVAKARQDSDPKIRT